MCMVPETCERCSEGPHQEGSPMKLYLPQDFINDFKLTSMVDVNNSSKEDVKFHIKMASAVRMRNKSVDKYTIALTDFSQEIFNRMEQEAYNFVIYGNIGGHEDFAKYYCVQSKSMRRVLKFARFFLAPLYASGICYDVMMQAPRKCSQLMFEENDVEDLINNRDQIRSEEPKKEVIDTDEVEMNDNLTKVVNNSQPVAKEGQYDAKTGRLVLDDSNYKVVGPLFGDGHHFDIRNPSNMIAAINARTKTKYTFKPESETARKFEECYNYIAEHWFSHENVVLAMNDIMMNHCGSDFYDSYKPKSMSGEEWRRIMMENWDKPIDDPTVPAFLKMELLNKVKPPRIIMNEGPKRVVAQLFTAIVYEHIIFYQLRDSNIKKLTRDQFADQISKRYSQKRMNSKCPCCKLDLKGDYKQSVIEVDQSSFDMSENYDPATGEGLLGFEYKLMSALAKYTSHWIETAECNWRAQKMRGQVTRFRFDVKKNESIITMMNRRVRHSGDRITSSGNFLIEYLSTLCVVADNPLDALKQVNKRIDAEKFRMFWNGKDVRREIVDYNGKCIEVEGNHALYCCVVEGDDVIARLEAPVMVENEKLIDRYHELGLDGKLHVETKTGAVNFCGINFLVTEGNTEKSIYSPDIIRALGKVGTAKKDQDPNSIYSSSLVRAAEFAGRQDWVSRIFKHVADKQANAKFVMEKEQIMHHGDLSKSEILKRFNDYYSTERGLSLEKQAQLLLMSMKEGLTPIKPLSHYDMNEIINDIVKLNMINWDDVDHFEAMNLLPDFLAVYLHKGEALTLKQPTDIPAKVEEPIMAKDNDIQSEGATSQSSQIVTGVQRSKGKETQAAIRKNRNKRRAQNKTKQKNQWIESIAALASSSIYDAPTNRPCFMPD